MTSISVTNSSDTVNIALTLNEFVIPPLPKIPLPPLPQISDLELRRTAVTHTSYYAVRRNKNDLYPESRVLDYERLEHIGDAILGSCAAVLLQELFPNFREGPATDLKADLVCDHTLAQLAERYGITDQLICAPSAFYVTRDQVKTKGSLFESWTAGVFYSYMKGHEPLETEKALPIPDRPRRHSQGTSKIDPYDKVEALDPSNESQVAEAQSKSVVEDQSQMEDDENEDKDLCLPELCYWPTMEAQAHKSSDSVPSKEHEKAAIQSRTYGQAMDYIYAWFKPLFTPIAHFGLASRREAVAKLEAIVQEGSKVFDSIKEEDRIATGAKAAVDIYVKKTFGVDPEVFAVRPPNTKGVWKVIYKVTPPEGKPIMGEAIRPTKKGAAAVAAYHVGKQLQLIK